ncbi:serpentine type 7TM GPCR receptor class ab chemoreceptor domain-containing protein [Ditylenchus destructor]|uniref:Serpentine type 7TM GPCR receptor class ab chemoreceptor domain-containing protein n=1 Tax=Ditylenchus destructor TaxID=166010 RepID=A0AAD4MLV3_9BILA|nr:serpentine type 7TM GPCR receptor class ab chemoreceptor domain-containing protein [Ditylenchus destructor]
MLAGGLILCILFVIAVLRLRSFHQNVRILLINFAFSYIVEILSRYMIVVPLLDVYTSSNLESSGSILWCRLAHGLDNTANFVGCLDMIVLVLERIVATLKYRTYEEQNSPLFGLCLIVVQWTVAFVLVWYNQLNNNTSTLDYVQIPCLKQYLNGTFQNNLNILFIATDVVAITISAILLSSIVLLLGKAIIPDKQLQHALSQSWRDPNLFVKRLCFDGFKVVSVDTMEPLHS